MLVIDSVMEAYHYYTRTSDDNVILVEDTTRYTVIVFRPIARRRLITFRPPLVFMRVRNPWVRERFALLG